MSGVPGPLGARWAAKDGGGGERDAAYRIRPSGSLGLSFYRMVRVRQHGLLEASRKLS